MLFNAADLGMTLRSRAVEAAAKVLNVSVQSKVRSSRQCHRQLLCSARRESERETRQSDPQDVRECQPVLDVRREAVPRTSSLFTRLSSLGEVLTGEYKYVPRLRNLIDVRYWKLADITVASANVRFRGVRSTGQCNTACSLSAGVSKPKVFRGR